MFVYSHLTLLILSYLLCHFAICFFMSYVFLFFCSSILLFIVILFIVIFYHLFLVYFISLLLSRFFFSIPYCPWDLSPLTRNLTWVLAGKVPNHWTPREFPKEIFLMCHLIPLLICSVIFLVVVLVITESTFNPNQFSVTFS